MAKINPKAVDDIFTDDVLNALPANDQIKRGVALKKKYDAMTDEEVEKKNQAISRSRKGQTSNHKGKARPWRGQKRVNKSVERHTEETKSLISQKRKGKSSWNKGMTGLKSSWNKDIAMAEEAKDKMRVSKNAKACKTPYGLFQYFVDLVDHCHRENLFPNRSSYLANFLRGQFAKKNQGYEYITQEEYLKLTKQDKKDK